MLRDLVRLRPNPSADRYPLLLAALFGLFFALPLIIFFWIAARPAESDKVVVSAYTSVKSQGHFVVLSGNQPPAPKPGEDFFVMAWVRFGAMPQRGERVLVFSTVDTEAKGGPGIALAVYPDGDRLRPVVYWQDESGAGQSVQFSPLSLPEGAWCAFGLSYRKDKYLGLHAAVRTSHGKPEIRLLGGYELPRVFPRGLQALRLGAFGDNKFRGAIGPVGFFSGQNLTGKLKRLMRGVAEEPAAVPEFFQEDSIRAWSTGDGGMTAGGAKLEKFAPPPKEKPSPKPSASALKPKNPRK